MTFNMKDFKAILSLCENLGTHIKLCFDSPGNPLVAEPHFPNVNGQVGCGLCEREAEVLRKGCVDAVPRCACIAAELHLESLCCWATACAAGCRMWTMRQS